MLGVLLVDKPLGITSHDVVNDVRKKFRTRRVGHAGTLDPLATGVLVVAVGPATRFLQYLPLEPKVYVASIRFGVRTETYDAEGEVISTGTPPSDLQAALEPILPKYLGLVRQVPPMFSAIKVKGKPLYSYARKGETVEREERTIHITSLELGPAEADVVQLKVVCSGGTYIRTLADDLGNELGCGAHLVGLSRESVGRFHLDQTTKLAEIEPAKLIPLREGLTPMPIYDLDESQTKQIREGRQIRLDIDPDNSLVALAEPNGTVFSVARLLGNVVQPECVIPGEAVFDAT